MTATFKRRPGQPFKYTHYIAILDDTAFYSPATIVNYGIDYGLAPKGLSEAEFKKYKIRIRHTLSRLSQNHRFPELGDGMVIISGQAPIIGWTGRRWKEAVFGERDE